ncbi:MAG: ATP-binding protein [Methanobrevibacter sp.]|nr:ATP-binding protein [Methanobrevibacter sp.]MBR0370164.1 ATP-binding protein [Methanobrevibacter sp.]
MNLTIDDFPDTPFEPGRPVSPSNFKGRRNDCIKIIRYIPGVIKKGMPEHFFITGKRGMGKTSFIKYVSRIAEDNFQMIPIHFNNGDGVTLDELILKLIEKLSEEFDKGYWGKNFVEGYLKRIHEVKVAGLGFSLEKQEKLIQDIKGNFSKLLIEICNNFENKGIFFIIDDINGLSDNLEFTNWYKSLFESIQFNEYNIPVIFVLISYPKEFDNLCLINESFSRIFKLIEIDKLENDEIEEFFKSSFENMGYRFKNDKALDAMIYYSWGMPLIMQQIGESVLWNISDNKTIDEKTSIEGISDAAIELGNKQIRGKLRKIRSEHYEDILIKLAKHGAMEFKKSEVLDILNDDEKRVFNRFLQRSKELGIIESIGREKSGEYAFVNRLYFAYFLIKSLNV